MAIQSMGIRQLSTDEIIALQTLNVCANAAMDKLGDLRRRLTDDQLEAVRLAGAVITDAVQAVIEADPDEDHRTYIKTRMSRLQLQFGFVRKHPDDLVLMQHKDAQTLLWPVLQYCDLECPCVSTDEHGDRTANMEMVKRCEIRKALKRVGMSELGLGSECPYHMMGVGL